MSKYSHNKVSKGRKGVSKKLTFFRFSQYIEIAIRFLPDSFYLFALRIQSWVRLKPRKLLRFELNIVDHCNLNCAWCDHFSPLAKESYIKVDELEKDFARLSGLTKGKIEMLHLVGGEPLLHPEINRIIEISRKYFPLGGIKIITNGILLLTMDERFWKTCQTNKVVIAITKYPIKLDMNRIIELIRRYSVLFECYSIGKRKMRKRLLDLSGAQNAYENFKMCHMSNSCIHLRNGKLYTCAIAPCIKFFNSYFGKQLKIDEKDYIDIYKVNNIEEIFNFLAKPIPFCKYCNLKAIECGLDWKVSEKDINEWI
jgi:MoaA/NifB/PqqE/SkfB family radical SAM enzyme